MAPPPSIQDRWQRLIELRERNDAEVGVAARAYLGEGLTSRFLNDELPSLLAPTEPLRRRAVGAIADDVPAGGAPPPHWRTIQPPFAPDRPRDSDAPPAVMVYVTTAILPPGAGWPWDPAAEILRLQQGRALSEARGQTYDALSRREKHRARKIVERMLWPQSAPPRRAGSEVLRSSRAHSAVQRDLVDRTAVLLKRLTGKFPGYTRDWNSGVLGGAGVSLLKAVLQRALQPLPVVGTERIVQWLQRVREQTGTENRASRRDGLSEAQQIQWVSKVFKGQKARALPSNGTFTLPVKPILDLLKKSQLRGLSFEEMRRLCPALPEPVRDNSGKSASLAGTPEIDPAGARFLDDGRIVMPVVGRARRRRHG